MQDGNPIGGQNGIAASEREAMLSRIGTFLQNHNGIPKDKVATVARNLENQCFQSSSNQQQYLIQCSGILNQLTTSFLQQKNANNQMQFQQGNQLNTPAASQNLQATAQRPFQQFPMHQGQNLQAQQLQKQLQMTPQMQFQQQMQGNLQPEQLNDLQRRQALAQLQQNMGMPVSNQGNFAGNNMLPGTLNAPSLGRPRPNQQAMQNGASAPPIAQNLGMPSLNQQVRPGVGNPASQITPQMILQLTQSPGFQNFASQRGLTLLQAKNLLMEQMNANNNNNNNPAQGNANINPGPKVDLTPNNANNAMKAALQGVGGLATRPGPMNPAQNLQSQNKTDPTQGNFPQMQNSMGLPGGASMPASQQNVQNGQAPVNSQAQLLAQRQMQLSEASKVNPTSSSGADPQLGINASQLKLTPANAYTSAEANHPTIRQAIELAKIDLKPKLNAIIENFKEPAIRYDVSPEERAQIMEFLNDSALLVTTIDHLIPISYVLTKTIDLPRLLILFKHMISLQFKYLPEICLTVNATLKMTIQVFKAMELVRLHISKFPKDPASGVQTTPKTLGTNDLNNSSLSTSTKTPQAIVIPQNTMPSGNPLPNVPVPNVTQATAPENHQLSRPGAAPNETSQATENDGSNLVGSAQKTGLASEPAQDFKFHIPNPELSLKLPQKNTPKSNDHGLRPPSQASNTTSPMKPFDKIEPTGQSNLSALQTPTFGAKRIVSTLNTQGLKPSVSAQLSRSEKEIAHSRSQFKNQPLAYAASAFKELEKSSEQGNPVLKISKTSSRGFDMYSASDLYHYDPPETPDRKALFSYHGRSNQNIRGFGDITTRSK